MLLLLVVLIEHVCGF